jgi:hypothetical protein
METIGPHEKDMSISIEPNSFPLLTYILFDKNLTRPSQIEISPIFMFPVLYIYIYIC